MQIVNTIIRTKEKRRRPIPTRMKATQFNYFALPVSCTSPQAVSELSKSCQTSCRLKLTAGQLHANYTLATD